MQYFSRLVVRGIPWYKLHLPRTEGTVDTEDSLPALRSIHLKTNTPASHYMPQRSTSMRTNSWLHVHACSTGTPNTSLGCYQDICLASVAQMWTTAARQMLSGSMVFVQSSTHPFLYSCVLYILCYNHDPFIVWPSTQIYTFTAMIHCYGSIFDI